MLDLNTYLRDLAPRERVYDVRLNRRLAMRVFPNGTRVWVYWRSPARDARGRTIGVFPQMSTEAALEDSNTVLEWSRFSNLPEADLPDDSDFIQTGNFFQLRKRNQRIRQWAARATVGATVTLTAILMLKWVLSPLFADGHAAPGTTATTTAGTVAATSGPAQPETDTTLRVSNTRVALREDARIRRATFASDVIDHEPVDSLGDRIVAWPDSPRPVFLFTDLQNFAGQTIRHRWLWRGELQSDVGFEVGSDWRWRVFSLRKIEPDQIGDWEVSIETDTGIVIGRYPLRVDAP